VGVLDLFRLDGKVAVVTGGGTGIGRAIAIGLAEAGASVVVSGRRPDPLEAVRSEIEASGGMALAVPADVTVEADLDRLATEAVTQFGALGVWVNNAGGLQGEPLAYLDQTSKQSWDTTVARNFTAVWMASKVASEHLREGGVIINVSSIGGSAPGSPLNGVYGACKAAVNHLTKTYSGELARRRIRVNAIAPGHVATEDYYEASGFTDAQFAKLAAKQPLGRLGCDADFAAAAVYLASEASSWVTGHVLAVTGTP
jgi:NAD(P)-dependent dehydrogenase (short-subunit alcohol dehydrogenase family)